MADGKWLIKFTDGTETTFYGSLRTHESVLYAERYGGFGGRQRVLTYKWGFRFVDHLSGSRVCSGSRTEVGIP